MTRRSTILDDALRYQAMGWSVIPITHGTKRPALPMLKEIKRAPADPHTIRDWFEGRYDLGIGVWTGPASGGLTCRDFDDQEAYAHWKSVFPTLAKTLPTVATHRGYHVYCVTDSTKIVKRLDGEIRANGNCLLPPSIHPKGTPYRWLIPPNGSIPRLGADESGFWQDWSQADDVTEQTEQYPTIDSVCSVLSVCSVTTGERFAEAASEIDAAIVSTLPSRPGERNRRIFEFARALKAIPALADAQADDLRQYVEQWHALALPVIRTKEFEETWIDFLTAWPNVKFPMGSEPVKLLFRQVADGPLPPAANRYGVRGIKLLVGLCEALQRTSGTDPFFLACRIAGRLLGVNHVQANRWLWLLQHDKVIVCVQPGTKTKAARYRWTCS